MPPDAPSTFQLFGPAHLATLATLGLIGWIFIEHCRTSKRRRPKSALVLAICCLLSYPLEQITWHMVTKDVDLEVILPFHLCDIAAVICAAALLTRRNLLCELAYCWGLAGTLQGLITPNIHRDFPDPVFFSFFWQHGVIVIAALMLPLGLKWRPRKRAFFRVFLWTQAYVLFAIGMNLTWGTNFGFLREKPTTASLIDHMPDWPWYILILEAIAATLFLILLAPLQRRKRKKKISIEQK